MNSNTNPLDHKNLQVLDKLTVLLKTSCKHLCGFRKGATKMTCNGDYRFTVNMCCSKCTHSSKNGCTIKAISCAMWHCKRGELHLNTKFRRLINLLYVAFNECRISDLNFNIGFRTPNTELAKGMTIDLEKCLTTALSNLKTKSKLDIKYANLILNTIK